jgi:hypothetical protein
LLGGVAAIVLAGFAIVGGTAGLQDWRAEVRERGKLAAEQAENITLDRQRVLYGWSPGGVEVYGVELVTERAELSQAVRS